MDTSFHPETGNWIFHLNTVFAIIAMMALYSFGVWLRTYVFPSQAGAAVRRQLLASVPVGLITMAVYGKTSLAGLNFASSDVSFDLCLMAGYIIVFGMMSRETLDRIMKIQVPTGAVPNLG
jgi:hypothetical protein